MNSPARTSLLSWTDRLLNTFSQSYITLTSILVHLVLLIIFGSMVLFDASKPPPDFVAEGGFINSEEESHVPPAPDPTTTAPTLPDVALSMPAASVAMPMASITAMAPATFSMPDVRVSAPSAGAMAALDAAAKAGNLPQGSLEGVAAGGRGQGGATDNPFGTSKQLGNNAFTGYFYDLKQTAGKKPVEMNDIKFNSAILEFSKTWDLSILASYYRSSQALSTFQIFIPEIKADEAPKAFDVEREVQPSLWAAVYKGSFVAPESGKFRFVGRADDIILVRLDGKLVLDGSLHAVTQTERYELNDTIAGPWFSLRKGQKYEMDVLVAEVPGGVFTAWLNIEKENRKYAQRPENKGNVLPVFQLSPAVLPPYKAETGTFAKIPTMAEEGMVFPAR